MKQIQSNNEVSVPVFFFNTSGDGPLCAVFTLTVTCLMTNQPREGELIVTLQEVGYPRNGHFNVLEGFVYLHYLESCVIVPIAPS